MTTLLWCITAIALALLISRYNQSNKLFWVLVISFLAGISGAAVFDAITSKESPKSKEKLTQVCPTQGVSDVSKTLFFLAEIDQIPTTCHIEPILVSQDYTPALSEPSFSHTQWVIPTHTPPPQTKLS